MDVLIPLLVAAALLAAAFALLWDRRRRDAGGAERPKTASGRPEAGACPLCLSVLGPGERVKSDIYPGENDRIMRIFGCPHCWPPTPENPRRCPVCGAEIAGDEWAVARYFERPGRRHVHVLGCSHCRERRR